MQHIANGGTRRRGHDTNAPRESWQAPLALESEQPLHGQFHLEALELPLECPDTGLLHVLDDELVITARLVKGNASACQDLLARLGRKSQRRIFEPEHRATHLRVP